MIGPMLSRNSLLFCDYEVFSLITMHFNFEFVFFLRNGVMSSISCHNFSHPDLDEYVIQILGMTGYIKTELPENWI